MVRRNFDPLHSFQQIILKLWISSWPAVLWLLSYRHTLVQWCYCVRNLNDLGFCSPCATKSLFLFATMGCIFVTLTNEEHMLWCLAEIILLDSLDHQKSHRYLIPCCQFLAPFAAFPAKRISKRGSVLTSFCGFIKNFLTNSYFILQIYHAKSFKMKHVKSLGEVKTCFWWSKLYVCYFGSE